MSAQANQKKSVRNFFLALFFLVILAGVAIFVWLQSSKASVDSIAFQDGDIVLQTFGSGQSLAILMATQSPYTHVGIIQITKNGPVVIEAVSTVMQTPLAGWIERGQFGRVTVLRNSEISDVQNEKIVHNARRYLGSPYDIYFSEGDDHIYCSELVWLAYKDEGLNAGKVQKVRDLSLNSAPVQKLIEQRWKTHPSCESGKAKGFDDCWQKIMDGNIITPASIAKDKQFSVIYSNYP